MQHMNYSTLVLQIWNSTCLFFNKDKNYFLPTSMVRPAHQTGEWRQATYKGKCHSLTITIKPHISSSKEIPSWSYCIHNNYIFNPFSYIIVIVLPMNDSIHSVYMQMEVHFMWCCWWHMLLALFKAENIGKL